MRVKTRKSTAQLLGDYREALSAHYRGLRATNERTNRPPKPANTFPMNLRHLTDRIESEELNRHNEAVKKLAEQKQLNTPCTTNP